MSTPRTCRRGHTVEGPNIQQVGKEQRCRACKQASENTKGKPDERADIQRISDEQLAKIWKRHTAQLEREARHAQQLAPSQTAAAPQQPAQASTSKSVTKDADKPASLDEVLRLLPAGCKARLRQEDADPNDWPSVVVDHLIHVGLVRRSPRKGDNKKPILSARGKEARTRLNVRLKGKN